MPVFFFFWPPSLFRGFYLDYFMVLDFDTTGATWLCVGGFEEKRGEESMHM